MRDASQQALTGTRIEAEDWPSCKAGDLLFFGNPDRLNRLANRLKLNLDGVEIVDMRADNEQGRRATYAKHLAEKCARTSA